MVARPLQPLVVEGAVPSLADHRGRRRRDGAVGLSGPQPGDDLRNVRDGAFRQIPDLGARVGQDLPARPVIELLGHFQRLRGRPAEARAAQLLERRQVVQPGRALPPVLDPHPERALEFPRGIEADAIWYLIERAVLSAISTCSSVSMICCTG